MTLDEQRIAERQNELLKERCKRIEAGTLKTCQPMGLECAPGVPAIASDECPACGRKMSWFIARQAWICVREGCQ